MKLWKQIQTIETLNSQKYADNLNLVFNGSEMVIFETCFDHVAVPLELWLYK